MGQGMSEELLMEVNREATRRMTALVAPQASEQHGPDMLRLSMGPLFEQVHALLCSLLLLLHHFSPLCQSHSMKPLPCMSGHLRAAC